MLFVLTKTKTDQEGTHFYRPWHVYANPLTPVFDPFLALQKKLQTVSLDVIFLEEDHNITNSTRFSTRL